MPLTKTVKPVSSNKELNQEIDGLLSGTAWLDLTITYSFPNQSSDYGRSYGSGEHRKNFGSFSDEPHAKDAFRSIFYSIESFTNLSFVENTGIADKDATIRLAKSDLDKWSAAWAYYPSERPEGGDAWFSNRPGYLDYSIDGVKVGGYTYTVMMHELGHSLGLKHSFENTTAGKVPIDSLEYTVMSYSSYAGAGDWYNAAADFPQTLMMNDIAALQYMYGADLISGTNPIAWAYLTSPSEQKYTWYNPGDTTYTWSPVSGALTMTDAVTGTYSATKTFDGSVEATIFMTIWDNGGREDTYDFSQYGSNLTIDLRPGQWVSTSSGQTANLGATDSIDGDVWAVGNIANALTYKTYTYNADGSVKDTTEYFGSLIENAKGGSGQDIFIANVAANEFWGGAEADAFRWLSAADLVNDPYFDYGGAEAWDKIWDFQSTLDVIDLTLIDGLVRFLGFSGGQLLFDIADDGKGIPDASITIGTTAFSWQDDLFGAYEQSPGSGYILI